jgi:aryl-alcohol dehydrogenase-like predicted oxidoreductase
MERVVLNTLPKGTCAFGAWTLTSRSGERDPPLLVFDAFANAIARVDKSPRIEWSNIEIKEPMNTRKLGNSDLMITPIGFGAWAVGGPWQFGWGAQSDRDSIAAIHRALEMGINWIDTAAVYGLGHSEEVVAKALRDWTGKHPYVFTKCGMVWNEKREVGYSLRAQSIRRECEASLRRLSVDAIDLYQIHWPADDLVETLEGWATMADLQKEGKVRWIGVSNFSLQELQRAMSIAAITSLQPPYSLLRRDAEKELLPFCERENIGVIVYSPMASGLLTGAMTRERVANLPADDWRRGNPDFQEPKLSENLALVERLRAIGARHSKSPVEVAIAWTLRKPVVTGAIVGARNAKQVDGIIGGATLRLTPDEIKEIEADR